MNNNMNCTCEKCSHKLCANRVPVFSGLSADEVESVVNLIVRKKFLKGEIIMAEGNPSDALIIVSDGQVKAFRYTYDGKEQILYIFSKGDFFGEKNLFADNKATYFVEALEDTLVCTINRKDFQKLLRQFPDIGLKIIEELSHRLMKLEDSLQGMGTKSIESRVSAVLLEFAKKYGKEEGKGILIILPLSREGIANYIGVTRETVSRKLSLLNEEGIIEMIGNKKILILDINALEDSV